MPDLKLGRLPDRVPIKIAVTVSPDLHKSLQLYAELYHRTYGEDEPIAALIPYMLQSFLDADRNFAKAVRERSGNGDAADADHASAPGRRRRRVQAAEHHPPQAKEQTQ